VRAEDHIHRGRKNDEIRYRGGQLERTLALEAPHHPHTDWRADALGLCLQGAIRDEPLGENLAGRVRHEHLAADRKRLDASCEIDRVAYHPILDPEGGAHVADDGESGVDTDAHLERGGQPLAKYSRLCASRASCISIAQATARVA